MVAGRLARNSALCGATESPEGCGTERSQDPELQVGVCGCGALARGAKKESNSTPEEAVEAFEAKELLIRFTALASCNAIPSPSQPATLFTMIFLVPSAWYHRAGWR